MSDNDTTDGFSMDEYERQLDEIVAGVVPDDHAVHDRLD